MHTQTVSALASYVAARKDKSQGTLNLRHELVDSRLTLFVQDERGPVWEAWTVENMPTEVYQKLGLWSTMGAEEWLNVIEHNAYVAATALTIAQMVQKGSLRVKTGRLVRAAFVHDAAKRLDVQQAKNRNVDTSDTLRSVLAAEGYSSEDIAVAVNTNRAADRLISTPAERLAAIEARSLEANILAYAEARVFGTQVYNLKESQRLNLTSKLSKDDAVFFHKHWLPYYRDVENYLGKVVDSFDPSYITDDAVYRTVLKITKDYHRL